MGRCGGRAEPPCIYGRKAEKFKISVLSALPYHGLQRQAWEKVISAWFRITGKCHFHGAGCNAHSALTKPGA